MACGTAKRRSTMADRFSQLLRARRTFKGFAVPEVPKSTLEIMASGLLKDADAAGLYVDGPTASELVGRPIRSAAYYPAGDRGIRRHEVMHGIRAAAVRDPSLSDAIPWWARGAETGSLRDELLARLASRQEGSLLDWPLELYATRHPKSAMAYRSAKPVQAVARFAYDNPVTAGALAGGAAVGVPLMAWGLSEDPPPEEAQRSPDELDRIIDRLSGR